MGQPAKRSGPSTDRLLPAELEARIIDALRSSGARFALLFGSVVDGTDSDRSDLDVAAWWGGGAPGSWEVALPSDVDLVVLDSAPLWLAGRVAQQGSLLFDDDPVARVGWQVDTRIRYLDRLPLIRETQRTYLEAVAGG